MLYSYLVEDDPLVKYAVHRYVQRLQNTGAGGFDFERETQQMPQGQIPNVGTIPLLVASGYSWETHGDDRLSQPTGRLYLFQPKQYWGSLVERLSEHPGWEGSDIHAELRLRPADETYGRAEPMEGDA